VADGSISVMSDAITIIRRMHDHRLWVRLRIFETALPLGEERLRTPFEMGAGSPLATLEHIHGAERVWLGAILGDPTLHYPSPDEFGGLAGLLRVWAELDGRWESYLASLTAEELGRPVTRPNRAGQVFTTPVEDILIHVCTHGLYHTAQLSNMLRRLGAPAAVPTDFIVHSRERGTAVE